MGVPGDEHERTIAFAETALGQIRALHQAATPRNYEIWYNYATGYNPALNQIINKTIEEKGSLGETDLDHIFTSYIAPHRVGDRIDAVNGRLLDEVAHVLDTITSASGSAKSYSKSLADATKSLSAASDGEGLRAILERLVAGTREMEANNRKLE